VERRRLLFRHAASEISGQEPRMVRCTFWIQGVEYRYGTGGRGITDADAPDPTSGNRLDDLLAL